MVMRCVSLFQAVVIATFSLGAAASERATPAEAKAMLDKALTHYKSAGRRQALADFSAKKAPFADRELYVVCLGADRRITAHGAFPAYVGQSVDVLKDASGKPLGGAIIESATQGDGTVHYMMLNPVNAKTEPKVMFAKKVGEEATETVIAAMGSDTKALTAEAADLVYHLLVLLADAGLSLDNVRAELARRTGTSGLTEKANRS